MSPRILKSFLFCMRLLDFYYMRYLVLVFLDTRQVHVTVLAGREAHVSGTEFDLSFTGFQSDVAAVA